MTAEEFDLVILGSGEASKNLAWTFGKEGRRVAVVERKYIGGSCPNIACLPSKNIIHSAKAASYARRGREFGIHSDGFAIDMVQVRERKRAMVRSLVDIHIRNFEQSGSELILGHGKFVAPKTVEVAMADGRTRQLRGTNVIIGTGTRARIDFRPGLLEAQPMTHIELLELGEIPEHLLVVGGGYIGLEFAQAFRRFGSRVTVIDRNSSLLHNEDHDVIETLQALFDAEGIEVIPNADVESVNGVSGGSVRLNVRQGGSSRKVEGTHLLVATGRTPNTDRMGLEVAGVELTDRGYIRVNERLETTAPGVWAVGEVAGSSQFTHIAYDDYRIVRDNLAGGNRVTTGRQVPFCLFTDPEVARIGLSEKEARRQGIRYRLFKIPMAAVLRTRTLSETSGFLKALVEIGGDRLLGFAAFGVGAGEIMGAAQIAMIAGLPYTVLRDAILTHPTLVEGLNVLFSSSPTQELR